VDLGVLDAEAGAVEVAADACEQIALVGAVDQHLQAVTHRRRPRTNDRQRGVDVPPQRPRVPGDVRCIVPCEVADLQRLPQWLFGAGQGRMQGQVLPRLLLAGFDLGGQVGAVAAQGTHGLAVQIFQQLALPGVPDLGAGAADVGDGQQVQRRQPARRAHQPREAADDVAIGEVLFLRDAAHREVVAHQELDQKGIFAFHAMGTAETPGLDRAQFGMVASATLGDVMEDRRHVQHPGLVPLAGQLAAERVFVRMLRDEEAAHVAHHHQDVLVHRVDVEQVVLHAPHDAPEDPQVAAQHAGLVHQAQGVREPRGWRRISMNSA
jgi:hypothetical protein